MTADRKREAGLRHLGDDTALVTRTPTPAPRAPDTDGARGAREELLAALLNATASLAGNRDVMTVLAACCDGIVAASQEIAFAWVYWGDPDATVIRPTYAAGPARAHAERLAIDLSAEAVRGPARRTLATGELVIMSVDDPDFGPWKASAHSENIVEVLSLGFRPAACADTGLLAVGAYRKGFLTDRTVQPIVAFAHVCEVALSQAADHRRLEALATRDYLTGLWNRRTFDALIDQQHERSRHDRRPYGILLLDIDRFKLINDTYGHDTGDMVLRAIAARTRAFLPSTAQVGRWGGEEIICLLDNVSVHDATAYAEGLRRIICETPLVSSPHVVTGSVCIGVASYPEHGATREELLIAVDAKLYQAKRAGRNRVVHEGHRSGSIFALLNDVTTALAEGRLRAAYQPIVALGTREVVAEEALARVVDREGHLQLAADLFIDAMTQFELVHRVDHEVLRQSLIRCTESWTEGIRRLHFVNVSADFLRHPALIEEVLRLTRGTDTGCSGGDAHNQSVVIEITEREFVQDTERALDVLRPLLDFGFRLAIDDFGSGYSSFRYLVDLPIEFVKLEGTLVRKIRHDPRARAVVRSVQRLAEDLKLTTVAESVEDADTALILKDMGIDWGQGYFFGKPRLGAGQATGGSMAAHAIPRC